MEEKETRMTEELQEGILEAVEETTDSAADDQPDFSNDNRGVGVIEIVLILVVLIGLVLVFKEQNTAIINNAFTTISGDAGKLLAK